MEINHQKQGKKNRAAGARFELKVRKDMESNGWIVDRWTNNVELRNDFFIIGSDGKKKFTPAIKKGELVKYGSDEAIPIKASKDLFIPAKLIPAKSRFNMRTTGFPDFVCFKRKKHLPYPHNYPVYYIQGVECKSNGYLDKEEKEKCKWLLDNLIFSKILIASKGTKRGQIVYKEFNALSSKG